MSVPKPGHSIGVSAAKAAAGGKMSATFRALTSAARAEGQEDMRRALAVVLEKDGSLDELLATVRELRRTAPKGRARVRFVDLDASSDVASALLKIAEEFGR